MHAVQRESNHSIGFYFSLGPKLLHTNFSFQQVVFNFLSSNNIHSSWRHFQHQYKEMKWNHSHFLSFSQDLAGYLSACVGQHACIFLLFGATLGMDVFCLFVILIDDQIGSNSKLCKCQLDTLDFIFVIFKSCGMPSTPSLFLLLFGLAHLQYGGVRMCHFMAMWLYFASS